MRPAFRRGWEGEGKLNRCPGAGQRARSVRHTGAAILLWEREGKALGVPTQSGNGASRLPSPQRGTRMVPSHGAMQTDALRRQARHARTLWRSRSSASGRPRRPTARVRQEREARAPAGQRKDAAPLGARSAGQSAPLNHPAHFAAALTSLAPCDRHRRPRRQGRLGGASPRRRDCGIERGAGLPAGADLSFLLRPSVSHSPKKRELSRVFSEFSHLTGPNHRIFGVWANHCGTSSRPRSYAVTRRYLRLLFLALYFDLIPSCLISRFLISNL